MLYQIVLDLLILFYKTYELMNEKLKAWKEEADVHIFLP